MRKIVDWSKKGNVIRLFIGKNNIKDWYGDDWDDRPYEHNAGQVYNEYVKETVDIALDYGFEILEPSEEWRYKGNSPYSKDDFKERKAPIFVIVKQEEFHFQSYSELASASDDNKNIIKVYMCDDLDKLISKHKEYIHILK